MLQLCYPKCAHTSLEAPGPQRGDEFASVGSASDRIHTRALLSCQNPTASIRAVYVCGKYVRFLVRNLSEQLPPASPAVRSVVDGSIDQEHVRWRARPCCYVRFSYKDSRRRPVPASAAVELVSLQQLLLLEPQRLPHFQSCPIRTRLQV